MKTYDDKALVKAYLECERCRIVAEKFGCSDETVRRALIKYDVKRTKRHPRSITPKRATEEELKIIVDDYYNSDLSINDLARKYHRSQKTIGNAINSLGHGYKICKQNAKKISDEQILEDIALGLTRQEIADKHGVHVENLARRMRNLGVHAKYSSSGNPFPKIHGECWHYVKSFDVFVKNKHPQFIYLETQQKGNSKRSRIKCKKCGNIIERSNSTITNGNICCEYCKEQEQQQTDLQNERIKLMRFLIAYKELKTPKKCSVCGMEYHSQYPNSIYCSDKCKKKRKKQGVSIRKRCRKYNVYYDPQVKALDVFRRDHYICKICGLECNTEDDKWGYVGPYSPSVDHIIPLAKGGTHTWNNVQCAHIICNSYKRDIFTV